MRVLQIGNFEPPHSTENDLKSALENNGHEVIPYQEQDVNWAAMGLVIVEEHNPDLILWTRTGSLDTADSDVQSAALDAIRVHTPVVGYHLDLFWGLTARNNRETWVRELPYFQHTDVMFTADDGHDQQWLEAGVDHVWMPPAVAQRHIDTEGHVNPRFRAQVGFVGSYRSYHPEWPHRKQLVSWVQRVYRSGFKVWEGHIRGQDLADLYTTVPILIGDSCMLGERYWSDRIPETLGRGGFLIHPDTPGLADAFPEGTLVTYPLGDFRELRYLIDYYLKAPAERADIAAAGKQHVAANHTYEHRMQQMMDELKNRGLL